MLDDRFAQHDKVIVDKYHDPAADYEMTVRDYVLRPDSSAILGDLTITLPPVAEAKGRFYSILAKGTDTTHHLKIQDKDDSESWNGDIVLTESGERVMLYSDGLQWKHHSFAGSTDAAQILINNTWGTGFNIGAITIAEDLSGTALELGSVAASVVIERVDLTAAITGGNYLMGKYMTLESSATFGDEGFMIGHYIRLEVAHNIQDTYAIWGKCNISGEQSSDETLGSNQHVGVFGSMTVEGVAVDLSATGGCYGVLGVASVATGGTLDKELIGGYFEATSVDDIVGIITSVKAWMHGYCDYGVEIECNTNNNVAGVHILAVDSARMGSGIKFEAETGAYIHHAFRFLDADESDGASVAATTIDNLDAQGVIKIDCAGTHYYIPFWDADAITTEWADQ